MRKHLLGLIFHETSSILFIFVWCMMLAVLSLSGYRTQTGVNSSVSANNLCGLISDVTATCTSKSHTSYEPTKDNPDCMWPIAHTSDFRTFL